MSVTQKTASQERDDLKLIPPLAAEFWLYGGEDTVERARRWALDGHCVLAEGIPACAHGLYLMASCPGPSGCRNHFPQLDHARIWIPAPPGVDRRPFILSHPYSSEIEAATQAYADAHGLDVESYPEFG